MSPPTQPPTTTEVLQAYLLSGTADQPLQPNTKWICKEGSDNVFYFLISGPDLEISWVRFHKNSNYAQLDMDLDLGSGLYLNHWLVISIIRADTDDFEFMVIDHRPSYPNTRPRISLNSMQPETWDDNRCDQVDTSSPTTSFSIISSPSTSSPTSSPSTSSSTLPIEFVDGEELDFETTETMPAEWATSDQSPDEPQQNQAHLCRLAIGVGNQRKIWFRVSGPDWKIKRMVWKQDNGNCRQTFCQVKKSTTLIDLGTDGGFINPGSWLFIPMDNDDDLFEVMYADTSSGGIYEMSMNLRGGEYGPRNADGRCIQVQGVVAAPRFEDEEDYSSMPGEEEEKDNQDVVENQSAGSSKADQESDVVFWIYGILALIGVVLVGFLIYKFNKYRKRKQSREQRRSQRRRQRRKKGKGGKRTDAAVQKVWRADPENEEVVADGKDLEAQLE